MTEITIEEIERREALHGLRRPVRVLYVLDHTRPSYENKQLARILGQLVRMQHRAAVASIEDYGDAVEKIQAKNVPVVSLELKRERSEKFSEKMGALMRLRSFVTHNEPELLHLIGENARSMGSLAASTFKNMPVVCQTPQRTRRSFATRFLDGAAWMFGAKPTQLFLDQDSATDAEARFGSIKPYEVLSHGIDFAAAETAALVDFDDLPPGDFDIGMPIRPGHMKTIRFTLEAFKVFLGHCPKARLILIADRAELDLEPWLTDLNLVDRVLVRPLPPEPGSLFGRLHVLWAFDDQHPDQEMILQAMAIGLPVVVDHKTGLASDIQEIGGAIMRDGQWPQQFAEATRELLNDKELYENVGRAGKIVVKERHGLVAQAEKLRSVYARLVHGEDI